MPNPPNFSFTCNITNLRPVACSNSATNGLKSADSRQTVLQVLAETFLFESRRGGKDAATGPAKLFDRGRGGAAVHLVPGGCLPATEVDAGPGADVHHQSPPAARRDPRGSRCRAATALRLTYRPSTASVPAFDNSQRRLACFGAGSRSCDSLFKTHWLACLSASPSPLSNSPRFSLSFQMMRLFWQAEWASCQ